MNYFFLNWKMYLDRDQSILLANHLASKDTLPDNTVIFCNDLALSEVKDIIGPERVGTQNVAWVPAGAYTGATSAHMFKQAGATHALVGHSERRHIFNETNIAIRKKMEACVDTALTPVLCIGEKKEEREDNRWKEVLSEQLILALEDLDMKGQIFYVAYEPVWAIGTGVSCTSDMLQEVVDYIKQVLGTINQNAIILYGGSVSSTNIKDFDNVVGVEGVLIGSAGAKVESLDSMLEVLQ